MIFFSAHGVPLAYVEEAGDPYKAEMEECVDLIMEELEKRRVNNAYTLAYQVWYFYSFAFCKSNKRVFQIYGVKIRHEIAFALSFVPSFMLHMLLQVFHQHVVPVQPIQLHANGFTIIYISPHSCVFAICLFPWPVVISSLFWFFFHNLLQSRVGPVEWLKPYTDDTIIELGQKGVKSLLAVPIRWDSVISTCHHFAHIFYSFKIAEGVYTKDHFSSSIWYGCFNW